MRQVESDGTPLGPRGGTDPLEIETMSGVVVDRTDKDQGARENYVERFLMKIWEAKDVQGIEPFIKAMQIEPERAPEVFFAWKAVC